MLFRGRTQIGIDIGKRSLKCLLLKKVKEQVMLQGYFFHDLCQSNESYPESPLATDRLRGLVEVNRFHNKNVVGALENSEVAHLDFTLPEIPEKELKTAIQNEVEEELNMPSEDFTYDYFTSPIEEGGQNKLKIKVYWARKDYVMSRIETLRVAHLNPTALEPAITAQVSMLDFNGYLKEGKKHFVVDLGETHTSVSLVTMESVLFTQNYPIGSGAVNTALRNAFGWTYHQAETQKVNTSVLATQEQEDEASLLVHTTYAELLKNIKESYEVAVADSTNLENVLLLGGSTYATNIEAALAGFLGCPVVIVNPFQNIQLYDGKNTQTGEELAAHANYFSTAVGLALRGLL